MQAASPAAFYPCALLGLLALQSAIFSQDRLTLDDDIKRNEQAIERALYQRGPIDFSELPLRDAIAEISRQFQIPIVLCLKKLEEASVSADTPVSKHIDGLALESILRLVLRDMELEYTIRDEVLLITTPEDVESQLDTRTYPVLDLVMSPGAGSNVFVGGDYNSLIELITTTIKPDSWDDVGGPGAFDQFHNAGVLVVSQTQSVHRQIERLLSSLRREKTLQGIASLPLPTVTSRRSQPIQIPPTQFRRVMPIEPNWQLPRTHD
jgi:hypothetical protein